MVASLCLNPTSVTYIRDVHVCVVHAKMYCCNKLKRIFTHTHTYIYIYIKDIHTPSCPPKVLRLLRSFLPLGPWFFQKKVVNWLKLGLAFFTPSEAGEGDSWKGSRFGSFPNDRLFSVGSTRSVFVGKPS